MKHTYFYKSLRWKAEGTYYDEAGAMPLTGGVTIEKTEDRWTLTGFMEVQLAQPVRFTNDYEIKETDTETTLRWESHNPALGTLRGTFEIIGDSIISVYRSEDGVYSGTETLVQKDEAAYYNAGVSFREGKKMSSWTALLKAEEPAKQ